MPLPVRRRLRLGVAAAILALAGLPGFSTTSLALFADGATSTGTFGTDTLDPPTGLIATPGLSIGLAWTPTVDAYATGYRVFRTQTTGAGYVEVAAVTPQRAAATIDIPPTTGTWFYVLRSYFLDWTSSPTAEVSAMAGDPLAGFHACGALTSAAEPTGDLNGYETAVANACADDGLVATDAGTGTALRSASCTNPANDAHRFRDFALGVPATTPSITGIEVRVDASVSNNGGTSNLCVQLSWNAGLTWTAAQSVALSNVEGTYVIGGPTDTWGRIWAPADLADASFRVRVVDATTQNNKDYRLEFLGVRVTHT